MHSLENRIREQARSHMLISSVLLVRICHNARRFRTSQ